MTDTPPTPHDHRNRATMYSPLVRAQQPLPRLRFVLQRLLEEIGPELATSHLPAFTVVALRRGERRRRTLSTLDDGHVVLGRHTEADLCLEGDPSVSLRHVLIRALRLEDGTPVLRVLDLDTPAGFGVEGGEEVRSLVATGPFAVAVGDWVVAGIPHGVAKMPTPAAGGPYRVAAPVLHRAERLPRRDVGDDRRSHITLLPRPHVAGAPSGATDVARLSLASRRGEDTLRITDSMLERGVLVGRYERCVGHGSRGVTTTTVSRTHVLILREADEDLLYDLSSTGGTYLGGRRIRSVTLGRETPRVRLAVDDPVQLHWARFDA